ncbi:hypothetical protein LDO26_00495 [Luteimonas sp. BDR2-5]|uniref:hypothetical protein n=1 Tax=Proluteimonas luteida TaxID=2878685 RepID=UPI001E43A48C|nr:hypothetical protein [Luteimonas sp. BDR2-5]MCD9026692.1 hypothetical protein [Luteimonas sp. BDR2-5]
MPRAQKTTRPAPDQPRQGVNVGDHDRKSSKGDRYAHDNNASAEGNDASLTEGASFTRNVDTKDTPPSATGR